MVKAKLTDKDCKTIAKLLKERYKPRDLAKKYGVHMTTIYKRANYPYPPREIPDEFDV